MEFRLRLRLEQFGGEIEIPFESTADLESALKSLDWKRVEELIGNTVPLPTAPVGKAPRPELEGICTIGAGGLPRFSKIPRADGEYVGLVLFSVEPRHLSAKEVEDLTGLKRVASNFFTHSHWKKNFLRDSEGRYHLSPDGRRWVTEIVLPKLAKG